MENKLEALFEELIDYQRKKVLKVARDLVPGATSDDILNPHDFPELQNSAHFNFEDGILSGIVMAQMAVRSRILSKNED